MIAHPVLQRLIKIPRNRDVASIGTSVRTLATGTAGLHILQYSYVKDIVERRGPHREAHLKAAEEQVKAGCCLIAGASGNPPSGAMFVFKGKSPEEIEQFVKADPYIKADLVSDWKILPYAVPPGLNALEKN